MHKFYAHFMHTAAVLNEFFKSVFVEEDNEQSIPRLSDKSRTNKPDILNSIKFDR